MLTRFTLFAVFLLMLSSSPANAQTTVDAAISDLYESITFNENREPDFKKFRSLFVEDAFLISVKDTVSYKMSVEGFIQDIIHQRESGKLKAFKEYEITRKVDQFGNISQVFSTYGTNIETAKGSLQTRGINSIQLLWTNNQWKITSLIWYEENENHPLPGKYLPSKIKDKDS